MTVIMWSHRSIANEYHFNWCHMCVHFTFDWSITSRVIVTWCLRHNIENIFSFSIITIQLRGINVSCTSIGYKIKQNHCLKLYFSSLNVWIMEAQVIIVETYRWSPIPKRKSTKWAYRKIWADRWIGRVQWMPDFGEVDPAHITYRGHFRNLARSWGLGFRYIMACSCAGAAESRHRASSSFRPSRPSPLPGELSGLLRRRQTLVLAFLRLVVRRLLWMLTMPSMYLYFWFFSNFMLWSIGRTRFVFF